MVEVYLVKYKDYKKIINYSKSFIHYNIRYEYFAYRTSDNQC